jgi:hypothetical protein
MRLNHISFNRLELGDAMHDVNGMSVWLPYGWSARLVIDQLTGPQFGQLEDLTRRVRWLHFVDDPTYNYREELTRVDMFDRDLIWEYVGQGAFQMPEVAAALGDKLFQKIRRELEQRR